MADTTIHIHPAIFGLIISILGSLVGIVWWQLNGRIRKVEDWKVDKGYLKGKLEIIEEKFLSMERVFTMNIDVNKEDHVRLEGRVVAVQATMEEVKDCLNKMARNKEC